MTETLRWWLASTLIGAVAFPYAFRLLRFLPDRGYTAARTLGVLLVVYPLWLLSLLGLLSFSAGGAMVVLLVLGAGALALAGRDRHTLRAHLRDHLGLILAAEAVFALTLCGLAVFRAYQPAIDATEKLFELSLFTGVLRSEYLPPADPWYGGESMSYYYGGYLVAALFTKLTGVAPSYGFNLGVVLTGALVAVSAFGLGANLLLALAASRRGQAGRAAARRAAPAAGVLCVLLLLVIGNLEGVFELGVAHGWGGRDGYRRLGIEGLVPPPDEVLAAWEAREQLQPGTYRDAILAARTRAAELSEQRHWYPDGFWFWWRATRMGSGLNIIEFPFFSFMLGDLHAHVLVLPFTLVGLLAVFNLLRGQGGLGFAALRRRPLDGLFLALLAGMLALSNTWDQPVFLALLLAAVLVVNVGRYGLAWRAAGHALAFFAPVAVLSFVLYLPFFAQLYPATGDPRPVELARLTPGVDGEAMVSPPHHFLIVWGPLLLVVGSGIVAQAVRRRAWRAPGDVWNVALALVGAPLLVWAAAVIGFSRSVGALGEELHARATWWAFGSYWLVQSGVVALCLLGVLTVLVDARRPHPVRRAPRTYMVLTGVMGLLVLHGIELFYVLEPAIPSRINTLFKFSFIAWLLLATSGGALAVDLLVAWRRGGARLGPAVWTGATAAVLVLALVYPVTAAFNRTNGFSGPTTLDGLAFLRTTNPDEYEAIAWMNANLPGRPLVLEATGHNYSQAGRVSGRTGFPTLIGWQGHEEKLRGGRDLVSLPFDVLKRLLGGDARSSGDDFAAQQARVAQRAADVATIYRAADAETARALLRRYGIDYVYVGPLELRSYGTEGIAKFAQLGDAVFRNPSVTIYRVGAAPEPIASR